MTETLQVKRLRGSTIIKLVLIGNIVAFTLLCGVLSIPAAFGLDTLKWNGAYITGAVALIAGPLLGMLVGLLYGLFMGTFTYIGLRVYARFRTLELEYVPIEVEYP